MGKKAKTFAQKIEILKKKLNQSLDALLEDAEKFDGGTKSAATRLRKGLLDTSRLCNEKTKAMRTKIMDKKKSM